MSVSLQNLFLVGNPNVGKSLIFGHLTGAYTTVSNYPGTTVTLSRGRLQLGNQSYEIFDTPGINSLTPISGDEKVTRDLLVEKKGVVIQIADAKNLQRAIPLTLQLQELGLPMVLVVNMCDESERRGITIDFAKLEALLGIPVVPTVATRGTGIEQLRRRISEAKPSRIEIAGKDSVALTRSIWNQVATLQVARGRFGEKVSAFSMHRWWGFVSLAGILYLVYLFVGVLGAGIAVDFFEHKVFGKFISPASIWLFDKLMPAHGILYDCFVGQYGLITMGVSYGFAIVLPIVTTFFIAFSIMEDSGYLPRLAVMVNRAFQWMGLNGKAVLPMVLGLGCDTMATLTTRILETRKQRLIVTLLLALAVPCSAQLGILLGMFGTMPAWTFLVWLGVLLTVLFTVGWAANQLIPGANEPFIMELPPLRIPQFKNVAKKTMARLEWYVKEAIPLFLLGTFILFILDALRLLTAIQRLATPLVVSILGLPAEASNAFLIGFLRRDFGATGFFDMYSRGQMTVVQALVALVVITLFVPCVANVFMMIKEHGNKVALRMVCFIFPFAFLVGGILNWILK